MWVLILIVHIRHTSEYRNNFKAKINIFWNTNYLQLVVNI